MKIDPFRWPYTTEFLWAFQREADARASGQAIAAWSLGSIIDRRENTRMHAITVTTTPMEATAW